MIDNNVPRQVDVETPAISILAAASKTPFSTALKVTLGIGLARLALFAGFLVVGFLLYVLITTNN